MYATVRNDHRIWHLSSAESLLTVLLLSFIGSTRGFLRPPLSDFRPPVRPQIRPPKEALEAAFLQRFGLAARPRTKPSVEPGLRKAMEAIAKRFGNDNVLRRVYSNEVKFTGNGGSVEFPLDWDCPHGNVRGALFSLSFSVPRGANALRSSLHDSSASFSHLIDSRFRDIDPNESRTELLEFELDRALLLRWAEQGLTRVKLDFDLLLFSRTNTSRLSPANFSVQPELELTGPQRPSLSTFCFDSTGRRKRDASTRQKRDVSNANAQGNGARRSRRRHRHHRRRWLGRDGTGRWAQQQRSWCRAVPLGVSFKELEWDDWIIAPFGYMANYCEGSCGWVGRGELGNASNHAVLQALYSATQGRNIPAPCCVPTRLSSLTLVYRDDRGAVIYKTYADMSVKECGCR